MRVGVSSAGTQRHVLNEDEVTPMPRRTKAMCGAYVDIEVTRFTQRSICEMRICPNCLDLWIVHLRTVSSMTDEKVMKRIEGLPKRPLVRLAIKPLSALAGAFVTRRRRRLLEKSK